MKNEVTLHQFYIPEITRWLCLLLALQRQFAKKTCFSTSAVRSGGYTSIETKLFCQPNYQLNCVCYGINKCSLQIPVNVRKTRKLQRVVLMLRRQEVRRHDESFNCFTNISSKPLSTAGST